MRDNDPEKELDFIIASAILQHTITKEPRYPVEYRVPIMDYMDLYKPNITTQ